MVETSEIFKEYEEMGRKWLNGEFDIVKFGNINFNDKQIAFLNNKSRYCLMSGGFASGKTTAYIVKLILLSLFFPNNRILLGRKTRQDVERVTLPDFFDICPPGIYEHKIGPGKIVFGNGSEIIFFGLDALQDGAGQDIKKAEQAIKSLNLGAVFIDQLEEIEYRVFEALSGRLRRNVGFQQMNFTTNPANFWAYEYFKVNPKANTALIQTSMLDNRANLTDDFIKDQLSKGERYVKRYVYGDWSPDTLVEGGVFSEEYIKNQELLCSEPIREIDGIKIWYEPEDDKSYQIGIDPSEGSVDPCSITVVCVETGFQVASFNGFLPIAAVAEKSIQIALMYSRNKKPLMIPEATGAGTALIEHLKMKGWDKIYEREVFSQREKKKTKKLGFYTNYSSKTQLIENTKELFSKNFIKLKDKKAVEELKTFIYQNEVKSKGASAQTGYRDDRVMSTMLAYWGIVAMDLKMKTIFDKIKRHESKKMIKYHYE